MPSDDKKPIDGLLIGTMLGLIVLGIPVPHETKSKDLPYWVSQTMIYFRKCGVSCLAFCSGGVLCGLIKQWARIRFNRVFFAQTIVIGILMEVLKQVVYPNIVIQMCKSMNVSADVDWRVASAPCGYLWLYFGVQEGAICNIIGVVLMWAL